MFIFEASNISICTANMRRVHDLSWKVENNFEKYLKLSTYIIYVNYVLCSIYINNH